RCWRDWSSASPTTTPRTAFASFGSRHGATGTWSRWSGHAATISAGEWITATGGWGNDRTHGQPFKAQFLKTSAPNSVEGIEKYLASGMIRGIGPGQAAVAVPPARGIIALQLAYL